MTLALKPFRINYSVDLIDGHPHITALHNNHPVATDSLPFLLISRQPRPAECVRPVATLHLKTIHAVAAQHNCSPDVLKPYCLIGDITHPDGSIANS